MKHKTISPKISDCQELAKPQAFLERSTWNLFEYCSDYPQYSFDALLLDKGYLKKRHFRHNKLNISGPLVVGSLESFPFFLSFLCKPDHF